MTALSLSCDCPGFTVAPPSGARPITQSDALEIRATEFADFTKEKKGNEGKVRELCD